MLMLMVLLLLLLMVMTMMMRWCPHALFYIALLRKKRCSMPFW
jgi:hypothetical protein